MKIRQLLTLFAMCAILTSSISTLRSEDKEKPKSLQPEVQTAEWAASWWMPRHEEKLRQKKEIGNVQLLWIGDSITHGWEGEGKAIWEKRYAPLNALNIGFSGDRTEQVLWRFENGEIDDISPKVAIVMIGTNNAGHRQEPSEETAAGIKEIVAQLNKRLPKTKVLLLGIFPRGADSDDSLRKLNVKTNELIKPLADDKQVFFLDISDKFLDKDGTLPVEVMPDLLHPNAKGYEIWADAIDKTLQELLAKS